MTAIVKGASFDVVSPHALTATTRTKKLPLKGMDRDTELVATVSSSSVMPEKRLH